MSREKGVPSKVMKKLRGAFSYEQYFEDSIWPIYDEEGYEHIGTGVSTGEDGMPVKILIQLDSPVNYKIDLIVHMDGERPIAIGGSRDED